MLKMCRHVMMEVPSYTSADETDRKAALKSMIRHPVCYARFLGYLNKRVMREALRCRLCEHPSLYAWEMKDTGTLCSGCSGCSGVSQTILISFSREGS